MKPRSYAITGLAVRYIGRLIGGGLLIIGFCEALGAGCLLVASEREE